MVLFIEARFLPFISGGKQAEPIFQPLVQACLSIAIPLVFIVIVVVVGGGAACTSVQWSRQLAGKPGNSLKFFSWSVSWW